MTKPFAALLSLLVLSSVSLAGAQSPSAEPYDQDYIRKTVHRSKLKIRTPKFRRLWMGNNPQWTYGNGAERVVSGETEKWTLNETGLASGDSVPFDGLCEDVKFLKVVGDGYIVDAPGEQELLVLAATENGKLETTKTVTTNSTAEAPQVDIKVRMKGTLSHGLEDFNPESLNKILEKADKDANKVVTAHELLTYSRERSAPME
jgi:hypothetical protein